MKTIYGCYFYNFDYTEWFDTRREAENWGKVNCFEYRIVEKTL